MASGYSLKAAIKLGITWAESSWTAVDTVIPLVSEGLTKNFDKLRSKALIGQASEHVFTNGTEITTGDLVIEMTHGLAMDLITYGMGTRATTTISLADDLSANVFNLEMDKGSLRWRFGSCMIDTVTLAGEIGSENPVQVTLGVVCRDVVVTATAFPSISLGTTNATRLYPEGLRPAGFVRVGDLADTLDSGDDVPVSGFEFKVENGFKIDDKDSLGAYVTQPERNDFRKVSLKCTFPRYADAGVDLQDWKGAGTPLQSQVTFSSGPYISIPHMKIDDGANFPVTGPGVLSDDVTFAAFYNGSGGAAVNPYLSCVDQAALAFPAMT